MAAKKKNTGKNPAAVALGKLRAQSITDEERVAAGKARANKLTPERRKEIAQAAAAARWGKKASKKKTDPGRK
jgi:hypothetical protein